MNIDISFANGDIVRAPSPQSHREVTLRISDGFMFEVSWTGTPSRLILGCGIVMQGDEYSTPDLRTQSMMPTYCWDRVPPQTIGGRMCISGSYQKLPGVIWEMPDRSVFIRLPSWLRIEGTLTPTFQSILQKEGSGSLRLNCPPAHVRLCSTTERFDRWEEGPLTEEQVINWTEPPRVKFTLESMEAPNVNELLRALSGSIGGDNEVDPIRARAVGERAAAFVTASTHPGSGLIIEWKRRFAPGFRGISLSLPLYHTGLSELRPNSDPWQREVHAALVAGLQHPSALLTTRWGPLWHNSATLRIPAGIKFFSHLGIGLAGYPGGSATALRSIGEARWLGNVPQSLWTLAQEVAKTIVSIRDELGFWPIDVSIPDRGLACGATAEAAHALIEIGAHGDHRMLDTGLRVLSDLASTVDAGTSLSGYLRDNFVSEPDGVSWVALLAASAAAHRRTRGETFARLCRVAASGLTRWIRRDEVPGLDPVTYSFGPRIAPCEGFWGADALGRAALEIGDAEMQRLSVHLFNTSDCEQELLGFSEAVYLDHRAVRHPHTFACAYTAFAALRAARTVGAPEPRRECWAQLGAWTMGLRRAHTWSRVRARLGL